MAGNMSSEAGAASQSRTRVDLRFDSAVLDRIDVDARRLGITRTAWLHVAAGKMLAEHHTTGDQPAA
jgi:hypothetical protein